MKDFFFLFFFGLFRFSVASYVQFKGSGQHKSREILFKLFFFCQPVRLKVLSDDWRSTEGERKGAEPEVLEE